MQRVAVRPELQGRGIGSSMIVYCEEYASSHGYNEIYLHARATAVVFYCTHNYICDGGLYDEDGIPHQKMNKALTG